MTRAECRRRREKYVEAALDLAEVQNSMFIKEASMSNCAYFN